MILKILVGAFALGLGIWLGLPGRYDRDRSEIEKLMEGPRRPSRRTKRYFTPMAWLQRQIRPVDRSGRSGKGRFRLESPDD